MPPTMPDARIDELEARLAHQDHAVHELSNEVYTQQQQISKLETLVRQLAERLAPLELAQSGSKPQDEIPPHY